MTAFCVSVTPKGKIVDDSCYEHNTTGKVIDYKPSRAYIASRREKNRVTTAPITMRTLRNHNTFKRYFNDEVTIPALVHAIFNQIKIPYDERFFVLSNGRPGIIGSIKRSSPVHRG
jgi:hypothetical protein